MFGAGGVGGGVDASTGQCDGSAGVTPRAVLELFRVLKERESQYEYSVKVSMFELYKDSLRDLVSTCKGRSGSRFTSVELFPLEPLRLAFPPSAINIPVLPKVMVDRT